MGLPPRVWFASILSTKCRKKSSDPPEDEGGEGEGEGEVVKAGGLGEIIHSLYCISNH